MLRTKLLARQAGCRHPSPSVHVKTIPPTKQPTHPSRTGELREGGVRVGNHSKAAAVPVAAGLHALKLTGALHSAAQPRSSQVGSQPTSFAQRPAALCCARASHRVVRRRCRNTPCSTQQKRQAAEAGGEFRLQAVQAVAQQSPPPCHLVSGVAKGAAERQDAAHAPGVADIPHQRQLGVGVLALDAQPLLLAAAGLGLGFRLRDRALCWGSQGIDAQPLPLAAAGAQIGGLWFHVKIEVSFKQGSGAQCAAAPPHCSRRTGWGLRLCFTLGLRLKGAATTCNRNNHAPVGSCGPQ